RYGVWRGEGPTCIAGGADMEDAGPRVPGGAGAADRAGNQSMGATTGGEFHVAYYADLRAQVYLLSAACAVAPCGYQAKRVQGRSQSLRLCRALARIRIGHRSTVGRVTGS